MKKIRRSVLVICYALQGISFAFGQQELQIHHINIENGDATMIGIYDNATGQYTSKILIDGGMSTPGARLLPYIQKIAGNKHFNYVILTHYHNDHYTGLTALGTGQLTADSLVDPGGYDFHLYFPTQPALVLAAGTKPLAMTVVTQWTGMLAKAATLRSIKARSEALVSYGTGPHSALGRKLVIGEMGGFPVTLECVAGWGNTLGGGQVVTDSSPERTNANNFSLAFVLRCGEFRYFIGGDLGGTVNGPYIDQEDALISYLAGDLPAVHSMNGQLDPGGHICGFKADHHGSNNSNTAAFMKAMLPAVAVTSAGNEKQWMLPKEAYLNRLAAVNPLSGSKGVYFTNLYDWKAGNQPLTAAVTLFSGKENISFDYGNPAGHTYSYMIRVKPDQLATESDFEVDRVDITQQAPYTKLAFFQCHKK